MLKLVPGNDYALGIGGDTYQLGKDDVAIVQETGDVLGGLVSDEDSSSLSLRRTWSS